MTKGYRWGTDLLESYSTDSPNNIKLSYYKGTCYDKTYLVSQWGHPEWQINQLLYDPPQQYKTILRTSTVSKKYLTGFRNHKKIWKNV